MEPRNVILVSDQEVVWYGLRKILLAVGTEEFNLLKMVKSYDEAKELINANPTALLMTDVRESFGITSKGDATKDCIPLLAFAAERGMRQSMVLTLSDNLCHMARSLVNGAVDYLPVGLSEKDLLSRIQSAMMRKQHPDNPFPKMRMQLLEQKKKIDKPKLDLLTGRECQMMRLLAHGLSNAEIAMFLEISIETVKEHVQHVLRKLGFNDRTQAAILYLREHELKRVA